MAKGKLLIGNFKGMYGIFDGKLDPENLVTRTSSLESAKDYVKRGGPVGQEQVTPVDFPEVELPESPEVTPVDEDAVAAPQRTSRSPVAKNVKGKAPRSRKSKKAASF